ncbi:hypothetical protein GCM10009612_57330 [Streptomyces beijiangensis]
MSLQARPAIEDKLKPVEGVPLLLKSLGAIEDKRPEVAYGPARAAPGYSALSCPSQYGSRSRRL